MCGSIAKGIAIPNKSDADITLVLNRTPDASLLMKLEALKSGLLTHYSFITKIDTPICLISEVLDNPYGWGFWIKIICICVHGSDLGLQIRELKPSREFVQGVNDDTNTIIPEMLKNYDENPSLLLAVQLAKRLLRGLYSLTMDREESWEDDLIRQSEITVGYYPLLKEEVINSISFVYGDRQKFEYFSFSVDRIYRFLVTQLKLSIINFQYKKNYMPLVSGWIFQEFIDSKIDSISLKDIYEAVRNRETDSLPMTFIAQIDSHCVGTVSIFAQDLNERKDLSPWLAVFQIETLRKKL